MRIVSSSPQRLGWIGVAAVLGGLAGWVDTQTAEVQASVLALMAANFALTLPGVVGVIAAVSATVSAFWLVAMIGGGGFNPGMLIAVVPAAIAAGGGRLFGGLLDTAAADLPRAVADNRRSVMWRVPSTRALLAVALLGIAAVGIPVVQHGLRAVGHPAATWLAIVWQIISLLAWIACVPVVIQERRFPLPKPPHVSGDFTIADVVRHVLLIVVLVNIHAVLVVTLPAMLFVPVTPSWPALVGVAIGAYLPLDTLTYVAVLALAYASDVNRRREAAERHAVAAQLAALRARLNPHFLFNTLNGVMILARSGRGTETVSALEQLTDLLRYVLDERRPLVPLHDELAFVRTYLDVQRLRFGERLTTHIADVSPALGSALVPQLLLQPIVENAVEHGVNANLDGGSVSVSVSRDDSHLVLEVHDDGPGSSGHPDGNGIGLSSTRDRLRQFYSDRARVEINTRPDGVGTRVTIRVPLTGEA